MRARILVLLATVACEHATNEPTLQFDYVEDSRGIRESLEIWTFGDQAGLRFRYWPSGALLEMEPRVWGVAEGVVLEWHPNGELHSAIRHVAGRPQGPAVWFDKTGYRAAVGVLRDGRLHGLMRTYWPDGSPLSEKHLVNGRGDGPYRMWRSGVLEQVGQHRDDLPVGTWERYFPTGEVQERTTYGPPIRPLLPSIVARWQRCSSRDPLIQTVEDQRRIREDPVCSTKRSR